MVAIQPAMDMKQLLVMGMRLVKLQVVMGMKLVKLQVVMVTRPVKLHLAMGMMLAKLLLVTEGMKPAQLQAVMEDMTMAAKLLLEMVMLLVEHHEVDGEVSVEGLVHHVEPQEVEEDLEIVGAPEDEEEIVGA